MTRIGRQIAHFEHVDLSSVDALFSSDRRYRFRLTVEFRDTLLDSGRAESLAVILKNPSAADARMADATIRKVETFVFHRFSDVRRLHILNLFGLRATDPADLNRVFHEEGAMAVIGVENDHFIRATLADSAFVIAAWGNSSGIDRVLYDERIFRVKQLLGEFSARKQFTVRGEKRTKQPLHGLMWGYDYEIAPMETGINAEDA